MLDFVMQNIRGYALIYKSVIIASKIIYLLEYALAEISAKLCLRRKLY